MLNNPIFVSVLIITYNYGQELLRALDALANQTYQNFEIIIVDDASTDNTCSMVNDYINAHNTLKIRLIRHETNQGIIAARNTALQYATGDYLYIHDADDWMEPICLEYLVKAAQETDADRVIGEFQDVDTSNHILQVRNIAEPSSKWFHTMHDACLYKHSIVQRNHIQYIDGVWDDIGFNFQFSIYSHNIAYVHQPLFNYYVNTQSTSGAKSLASQALDISKFHNLLELVNRHKSLIEPNEWILEEYHLIKYYFFSILHEGRYAPLHLFLKRYALTHEEMKTHIPAYQKNANIHFFQENYDRKYGKRITALLIFLEKTHMIKPFLIAYHLLSKFIYFPV